MKPERYWIDARAKVAREGECRVRECRSGYMLQAAHVLAQKYDERIDLEDGTTIIYVDPIDVIPLCIDCHSKYDRHELDILPLLSEAEQAAAVARIGIVRALHRLTGQREYIQQPA